MPARRSVKFREVNCTVPPSVPLHRTKRPSRGILRVIRDAFNISPEDVYNHTHQKPIYNLSPPRLDGQRILDREPRPKHNENLRAVDLGGSTRSRAKSGSNGIYCSAANAVPSSAPPTTQTFHPAPNVGTSRRAKHQSLQPSIYGNPNTAQAYNAHQTTQKQKRSSVPVVPTAYNSQTPRVVHQQTPAAPPKRNHVSRYPTAKTNQPVALHPQRPLDYVPANLTYNIHRLLSDGLLEWDITRDLSYARYGKYGSLNLPDLDGLAVAPGVSKIIIEFTNSRLERWEKKWEPLVVRSPHGGAVTVRNVVNAIYTYFSQQLHVNEYSGLSQEQYDRILATYESRIRRGSSSGNPLRMDVLRSSTRFGGLAVKKRHSGSETPTVLSLTLTYA